MAEHGLDGLKDREREAVLEFVRLLNDGFGDLVSSVALFGSQARGEGTPGSESTC